MKKFIIAFLLLSLPLAVPAQTGEDTVPDKKLMALIREYGGKDGFEVIQVGSLGTSALKTVMKISAKAENDEDVMKALSLMKDIKKMAVVDYEDCTTYVRNSFNSRLEKLLSPAGLLMEIKDGKDTIRMYGIMNEGNNSINDFVMFAPSDCALICLFGSIPVDAVTEIAGQEL